MSIKPVLVPDHDAVGLRGLMDRFAEATTGPVKKQLTESAESENLAIGEKMARDGIEYDPAREDEIISMIGDYLRRDGMTTRQVRGYMIDPDFISDQLSYLPRKSGVAEAGRPDVMRHKGDKTVRVVKKGGKPIGEIGIDAGPGGNGDYYVKLYDGSYDAAGFATAEEALEELKYAVKQMSEGSLTEFAPSQPGGDDDSNDDGFDEETLRRMAAHWLEGDEDPRIEQLLAAAGWEIGQDEGYEDEPGVFVVMSGDEHGKSYISWPAAELRSAMSEGMSRAAKGYEKYGKAGMQALAKAGREGRDLDPIRDKYDRYDEDQAVPPALNVEEAEAAFKPGDRVQFTSPRGAVEDGVVVKDLYSGAVEVKFDNGETRGVYATSLKPLPAAVAESRDPVEQLRADIRRFAQ